eukprot:TRINITY_DN11062_c1_g1_i3.p2 TRINITY_DN11062_c1_g1~~TRINITY_DN11062_c1_g1_i3.p2  ORF type:complete len:138 (+),score=40.30 TRINITY_DN11062_c1_g1_i3:337-750(+)
MVMYVDSEVALEGGRELWGINKSAAVFNFTDGVHVTDGDGRLVFSARPRGDPPALIPTTVNTSTISIASDPARRGDVLFTTTVQKYHLGIYLKHDVQVPETSPLHSFMEQGASVKQMVHMASATSTMLPAEDLTKPQ